jgi:uncharacterized alkaline shock family protein YloU
MQIETHTTDSKTKTPNTPGASKRGDMLERQPESGISGTIVLDDGIVSTIAGMAARDVEGIASMGRSRLLSFGSDDPTRGVEAEVGSKEAALDMELVIEHGCDIRQMAKELRQSVAAAVDKMTGRKVIEVNIRVIGVELPAFDAAHETVDDVQPRVR